MKKIVVQQVFDTIIKDVSFYLYDYDTALRTAGTLVKDPSVIEATVLDSAGHVYRKYKNEVNYVKYYGKLK